MVCETFVVSLHNNLSSEDVKVGNISDEGEYGKFLYLKIWMVIYLMSGNTMIVNWFISLTKDIEFNRYLLLYIGTKKICNENGFMII